MFYYCLKICDSIRFYFVHLSEKKAPTWIPHGDMMRPLRLTTLVRGPNTSRVGDRGGTVNRPKVHHPRTSMFRFTSPLLKN